MPTQILNAARVKAETKPGRHSDGAGLYLVVSDSGKKRWVLRYSLNAKPNEMGLGSYPEVSLAEAREKALAAKKLAKEGTDPVKAGKAVKRVAASKPTFGEMAEKYIATNASGWKHPLHEGQWKMHLGVHAARLTNIPVDEITVADVVAVLEPIWTAKPETGTKVRARIEAVWMYAQAHGYIEESRSCPALLKGRIDTLLQKRSRADRKHHPAMPYEQLPGFLADLREQPSISTRALEFLILTATRSSETRGALWSEIDLKEKLWTIPAKRMKAGVIHIVPLSTRAVEILEEMQAIRLNDFVFPGRKDDKPLSVTNFADILRRLNVKYSEDGKSATSPHGFRSTFRDFVGDETSTEREVAEEALAHTVGNATEKAYRRKTSVEKRRVLMQLWSDYCTGALTPNVIPLGVKKA